MIEKRRVTAKNYTNSVKKRYNERKSNKKMSVESPKAHPVEDENDRPSSPRLIDPTRERDNLGVILQALNGFNDDAVKPLAIREIPMAVSLDSILQEFDRNHCFPTILADTNNRARDIALYHLYREELLPANAGINYLSGLGIANNPRTSIEQIIKKSLEARDITKEHLIASLQTARRIWKLTFSNNNKLAYGSKTFRQHITELESQKLKALYAKVQVFLSIIDSLIVIIERHASKYPNQELIAQSDTHPNPQAQLSFTDQQLPTTGAMPVETVLPKKTSVTWKTITESLEKKITPSILPLAESVNGKELEGGVITQGHEEREKSNWNLQVTLLSNHYHQFCNRVLSEPLPEILELINTLSQVTIGTAKGTTLLEKLEKIFKKQVKECAAKKAQVSDALLPEIFDFAYRVLEMSSSLKILINRNKDRHIVQVVQKKSIFKKLISFGETVKKKWNGWFSRKKTSTEKSPLKSKPKPGKSRMMWLAAGFASLFLGNARVNPANTTPTENIPVTPITLAQENDKTANTTNKLEAEKESNTLTGNTADGLENQHNASIQRGLQSAFKKPNAIGVFQQILGSELSLTSEQQIYLANTFAGIIRPHLHHFHTGIQASEIRVVYQGHAPHHKHTFKVIYRDRTETVNVHIPSWNDLSRGLANSLTPTPAHVNNSSVNIQHPHQATTPLAPTSGTTKSTKPTDADINAALDALSLADQTPTTTLSPTSPAPSEVDIALEELARSDRNKNRSA